jgi:hypothetical protein
MPRNKSVKQNHRLGLGRIVVGLAVLWALFIGQTAAQGGPIIMDGIGNEWDSAWQIATDELDVFLTDTAVHPHQPPTYARSGYDATGLWAHYQTSDDRWYFRLDVDGRAGDSDSAWGTSSSNLGTGTHGPDEGPLVISPFIDGNGLGTSESYKLGFQYEGGAPGLTAELGPSSAILPGVLSATTAGVAGEGIYNTTVPGVIEFAFDRESLFPAGSAHPQFWLSAQLGDNNDRVSDDQVEATLVLALDLAPYCPSAPITIGDQALFPLNYAIPASSAQGASNVVLTVVVPAGTTFVSASGGGTEAGGIITWNLGDLGPGEAGQVTFTLHIDAALTDLDIVSEMVCDEGLLNQAVNQCPVQQPPPTDTPTDTPPVVPEPATVTLMLAGLGGLGSYVAWQWRTRRRR